MKHIGVNPRERSKILNKSMLMNTHNFEKLNIEEQNLNFKKSLESSKMQKTSIKYLKMLIDGLKRMGVQKKEGQSSIIVDNLHLISHIILINTSNINFFNF